MTTTNLIPNATNEPLQATTVLISNIIESLLELGILVHDNHGTQQSNMALVNNMQTLIKQLKQLSNPPPQLQNHLLPIDVISYVEDGRNPDIYTREFVEVSAKSNARLKGKMLAFKKLQGVLSAKLKREFPRLETAIDEIEKKSNGGV
ncbi:uncharacterized protein LODBEIA_P06520 [Lodderomyces beijingensis]|uniref:Mediator of RNA polymerase II transcription subunit 10 n=1 Tax=Lodderomyces beijingensis TaxID=1775926 RepID=A0ABP0ZE35_9ASCO